MPKQQKPHRYPDSGVTTVLRPRGAEEEISLAWRQHDEEAMAWAELRQRLRSNEPLWGIRSCCSRTLTPRGGSFR